MWVAEPARSVFSFKPFRQYFAGQALSYAGDSLRVLVLPLIIYHLTSSAALTALTYLFEYVPLGLTVFVAGSLADRLDRKRLMMRCDLFRMLILLILCGLFSAHLLSVIYVYGSISLLSVAASLFDGGQASSIPHLVGRQNATQAMSALFGAQQGSALAGPTLGGALLQSFGALPALLVTASTYAASQVSLGRLPSLGPDTASSIESAQDLARDIALGFSTLLKDVVSRFVWFYLLFSNAVGMVFVVLLIPFMKSDLHADDRAIGFSYGVIALGAVAGSFIASKTANRWHFGRAFAIGQLLEAAAVVPIATSHSIWTVSMLWACALAGTQFKAAQAHGWRVRISPPASMGRVFAAGRAFSLTGIVIGIGSATLLAARFAPRPVMLGCGILYLALSLGLLFHRRLMTEER